jgi:PQQ-dependent dehydrogenase (methanol/ethanol family)
MLRTLPLVLAVLALGRTAGATVPTDAGVDAGTVDAPKTESDVGYAPQPQGPPPAKLPPRGQQLPNIKLIEPLPSGEWRLPAGDYGNTRYSPLAQIDTGNVKRLRVVNTMGTGIPRGHEGNPLVVDQTMYVVTPFPNELIAIDLDDPTGPLKWRFHPHPDPTAVGKACCDVVNRGASYADGKIIYNLLDAHTVAVDAKTGKEVWRTKIGEVNRGETMTMAPLVVKNLAIVGNSGGELGVRGKVVALDVATGKIVWTGYNTGPDADVLIGPGYKPFYAKDRGVDLGVTTWPPDQWKLGGSTVWGWISYDPGLNLIYHGTGNPGVWNADLRPGSNHFSCAIVARNADDGQVKWAYQLTPNDAWDYDEVNENILVDMEWKGKMRKLLLHPGRTGFMFVLDRETGEVLSAEAFVPVNWAKGYDLKTGLPIENPSKRPHMGTVTKDICPSSSGGKEFNPAAFSPRTGLLYIPAHNTCMEFTGIEANYIAGTPYLGASVKMYPGSKEFQGDLVGWDVANARAVWHVKEKLFPLNGGVLATGGDVIFYGTMDGWLKALHARTGELLWKFKLPSGVVGNPMTYLGPDGKQYLAIYAGIGGWLGATAFPSVSLEDPRAGLGVTGAMQQIKRYTSPSGVLFVFALEDPKEGK